MKRAIPDGLSWFAAWFKDRFPAEGFQKRTLHHFRFGSRLCENSDLELSRRTFVSITLNKKRTALAGTVERRKERKQFCAFSARARFHTGWVNRVDFGGSAACPVR
jgi:hypothetical protein